MIKHFFWTCCFSIAMSTYCNAQKIETEHTFVGVRYTQNGKTLSMRQLVSIMEPNPAAHALIRSARTNFYLGTAVSCLGGGLIGWEIPDVLDGEKPNWGLIGAGAALIGVAIPISNAFLNKANKAINLYNEGLKSTSFHQPTFQMEPTKHGMGLVMRF